MAQPLKRDPRESHEPLALPETSAPEQRLDTAVQIAPLSGSPARELQALLVQEWRGQTEARWPLGRTSAFILLTNGLFWSAIVWWIQALR